jgi:hypothetical protein
MCVKGAGLSGMGTRNILWNVQTAKRGGSGSKQGQKRAKAREAMTKNHYEETAGVDQDAYTHAENVGGIFPPDFGKAIKAIENSALGKETAEYRIAYAKNLTPFEWTDHPEPVDADDPALDKWEYAIVAFTLGFFCGLLWAGFLLWLNQ